MTEMVEETPVMETVEETPMQMEEEAPAATPAAKPAAPAAAQMDTKKLYVGGIPFRTTREELEMVFAPFGTITDIYLPVDRETGRPRGFAFVTMDAAGALKAAEQLNNTEFGGRTMSVNEAQPKDPNAPRRDSFGGPRRSSGGSSYGGGNGGSSYGGGNAAPRFNQGPRW